MALPMSLLAAGVALWIGPHYWIGTQEQIIQIILVLIPVYLLIIIFSFLNATRQQKRIWSSYRLIIDQSSIKRVQKSLGDATIKNEEISWIIETPKVGIYLIAIYPSRQIIIPFTLENYSELRLELEKRHPIETASKARSKWTPILPTLVGLLSLAAFSIIFLVTNPMIVAVVGILDIVGLIAAMVSIQRNMNISIQLKRTSWFVVFPLVAIAIRVFLVIRDWQN